MKLFSKFLMGAAVLGVMASGDASAAGKIVMDGSTTVGPIAKSFAAYFTKTTGTEVTVSESGSGNGEEHHQWYQEHHQWFLRHRQHVTRHER